MRKERFPANRRTKLHPRGDGPFQVKARVGDNAYIIDLPGDYGVSATFNVADLSPFEFDDLDSRTSPFEDGGTNVEIRSTTPTHPVTSSEMKGNKISSSSTKTNANLITHTLVEMMEIN